MRGVNDGKYTMFGSHCDENNCFYCTIVSVMQMYIDIIIMSREMENKQMIYVAKKLFKLMS